METKLFIHTKKLIQSLKGFIFMKDMLTQNNIKLDQVIQNI